MPNGKHIPEYGLSEENIKDSIRHLTMDDKNWKDGKFFGYVYYPGDAYYEVIKKAYAEFSSTNALNPSVFPSLLQMENEVVSMTGSLLHADELVSGCMTSGGTESIFMAVKAAKEWAKKNKPSKNPLMLLAETAHPAFCKAADAIELNYKLIKVDHEYRFDLKDLANHISPDTPDRGFCSFVSARCDRSNKRNCEDGKRCSLPAACGCMRRRFHVAISENGRRGYSRI